MIRKILIANRGEIALRIAKSCRKMGVNSLAVYSEADRSLPFVHYCDEAVALSGNQLAATYLDGKKLIEIARKFNCDALHPGYGFLSENAEFAKDCAKNKIKFIGPQPEVISEMGDKKKARLIAQKADVPVVPGYDGLEQDAEKLKKEAEKIGFPVLLKAAAGGGGKGMRIVRKEKEFEEALNAAKREAKNAFGNDHMLLEKYFDKVRHIEVQILGDEHGNLLHLNERECSIQRRYQKIIEESPSPAVHSKLRKSITSAALKLAKELNYQNAGTVEFILDEKEKFYFLEVNTRLQVEHPVTEAITGLDLVEWQIKIAEGSRLDLKQDEIQIHGHAIECRIYAEDPYKDFAPSTGKLVAFDFPEVDGLRIDKGVDAGNSIEVFYDPMIAKVITHGGSREEATRKMNYALAQANVLGPENNRFFLQNILSHNAFIKGAIYTHFLQDFEEVFELQIPGNYKSLSIAAAVTWRWNNRTKRQKRFRGVLSGWRNLRFARQQESFKVGDEAIKVEYEVQKNGFWIQIAEEQFLLDNLSFSKNEIKFTFDGINNAFNIFNKGNELLIAHPQLNTMRIEPQSRFPVAEAERVPGKYLAPMPGEITKVLVKKGDKVKEGTPLLILVSMKMENTISAQEEGTVSEIYVKEGAFTEADNPLLKLEVKK